MKEVWKPIAGYEGYYQVSNKGNVKSLTRKVNSRYTKRTIKAQTIKSIDIGRYFGVMLYNQGRYKRKLVHRLVAETFIPNPENKPQVNHKDGNKANNHVSNLEWVTEQENHNHAKKNGLKAKGERIGASKLNSLQVRIIRKLKGEMTLGELATIFKVDFSNISAIHLRKTWKHI